ncbi:HNH endonuclease [Candidatus Saccharibacteria bacterium]|nr:HNH endonuclease [Candidatus Saccharibacteria bacterium]
MPLKRSWDDDQLRKAVAESLSFRAVLLRLQLVPAGGNYTQVRSRIKKLDLDTTHFTGKRWNVGMSYHTSTRPMLSSLLTENSSVQSYKLKKRLFEEGVKEAECELCGWAEVSSDGRVPVELDHINGVHSDNRLENLRILCPNCHSLQPTHRGKNKRVHLARVV